MEGEKIRIDIWLWAARFFKTRTLAARAVSGGKVHLNGERVKPARLMGPDDRLEIHKGIHEFVVIVQGLSRQRLSAPAAAGLYEETPESQAARRAAAEDRRLFRDGAPLLPAGRPGKRDRRLIKKFIRRDEL